MSLTLDEVCGCIDDMQLDDCGKKITRCGDRFELVDDNTGTPAEDIGSLYEVPDTADEHGRYRFEAGPWTAYQYHPSYTAPNRANYAAELADLAAGTVAAVYVGVTPTCTDDNTWVFAIRTEG